MVASNPRVRACCSRKSCTWSEILLARSSLDSEVPESASLGEGDSPVEWDASAKEVMASIAGELAAVMWAGLSCAYAVVSNRHNTRPRRLRCTRESLVQQKANNDGSGRW